MFILIMNLFGLQKYSILSNMKTSDVGNCSQPIKIATPEEQNVLVLIQECNKHKLINRRLEKPNCLIFWNNHNTQFV